MSRKLTCCYCRKARRSTSTIRCTCRARAIVLACRECKQWMLERLACPTHGVIWSDDPEDIGA